MIKKNFLFSTIILAILSSYYGFAQVIDDTFDPITSETVPQTFEELWQDFDPRAEPLDTEILYEWEEDNIIFQVVRYRALVAKGQKCMVAGVYGYPKGGTNLPGLVNVHGGGQYADYRSVRSNAKRGYATITVDYTICKDGYQEKTGLLAITTDTTITVDLARLTGINSQGARKIYMYPNPVKDVLIIEVEESAKYHMTNIMGEATLSGVLNIGENEIELSVLAPGLYLITISDSYKMTTRKIVVN